MTARFPAPSLAVQIAELPLTKRHISHDEAREIARRFINMHFNNEGEHSRASIPANPERDDDLLLFAYIEQQRARVRELEAALEWRPLESAPRCGHAILFDPQWGVCEGNRFDEGWGLATFNGTIKRANPTHWLPLPPPPKEPS